VNHKIAINDKTDLGRLLHGSLVYSGALRSPLSSIVHEVPVNGINISISAEPFAFSGDIHIILNNISEAEYLTETADNRGKSKENCLDRVARIICADRDMIEEKKLFKIAEYIYNKQIEKIQKGILKIIDNIDGNIENWKNILIIYGGLGGEFIGKEAASRLGFSRFLKLTNLLNIGNSQLANAYSTALLVASKEG